MAEIDEHAELAPSSAHIWTACPGSVMMRKRYPDPPDAGNEAAEDGIAEHWLLAQALSYHLPPSEVAALTPEASNGVTCTDDMIRGATLSYDVVRSWEVPYEVERRVGPGAIHPLCFGTPDVTAYVPGLLRILDHKSGYRYVDEFENLQLSIYALEKALAFSLPESTDVELTVVQPNWFGKGGTIRTWRCKLSDLARLAIFIRERAIEAVSANPRTVAGHHCEFCSGRHACDTLQRAAAEVKAITGQVTPFDLSPYAVGRELDALEAAAKVLNARITGLQEQAKALLRGGNGVPGWSLEQGYGRETWLPGTEKEVAALGDLLGVNVRKSLSLITPLQVREAGASVELFSKYTHKPRGEMKLVRQDVKFIRRIFGAK